MKSVPPGQTVQDVSKLRQILIVEDEQPIREMVAFALRRAGFDVSEVANSRDARVKLADQRPDLMLVDWMLPDMSGLELTRQVKRDPLTRDVPIIMLTARAAEGDKVAGLDGGADDYVTKPFSPRELLSRINAVLRRSGGGSEDREHLQIGGTDAWIGPATGSRASRSARCPWDPRNTGCSNSS